jgi:hypothetical protein
MCMRGHVHARAPLTLMSLTPAHPSCFPVHWSAEQTDGNSNKRTHTTLHIYTTHRERHAHMDGRTHTRAARTPTHAQAETQKQSG